MVTYVEQAILRVTDQSTRQINTVNRSLAALFRTARDGAGLRNINITLNLRNINQTIAKVQQLDRLLRGLSRRMPPIGPGWGGGPSGGGRGAGGPGWGGGRTGNNRRDFGTGFSGGVMAGPILDPFSLGRMLSYIVVGQLYMQASNVVISGAQAAFQSQAITTTQNLTLAPVNVPIVNALAESFLPLVEGLSINDIRQLISNIALSIPAAGSNFNQIALAAVRAEERLYTISPDRAESAASILAKVLEFAQISQDPARAEALMRGYVAGIGATGATFSPESFLAALRVSGTSLTLDEQGIFNFMLALDEGGRRVGDNTNRMLTVLTQDAGVSEAQTNMLTRSGIIGPNGRPVQEELLLANQQAWVQAVIRPLLRAQGVDPTDNIAVRIALQEMGFVTREMRQVAQEIASAEERYFSAWQTAQAGVINAVQGSERDLGQSLRNLFASFSTIAVDTLVPLFSRLAGPVDRLANWMESFYGPAKSLSGEFAKLSETTQKVSAAVAGLVLGFWTVKAALFGLRLLGFATGASVLGRVAGGAATAAGTGPLVAALSVNTRATNANTIALGGRTGRGPGAVVAGAGRAGIGRVFAGLAGWTAILTALGYAATTTPEERGADGQALAAAITNDRSLATGVVTTGAAAVGAFVALSTVAKMIGSGSVAAWLASFVPTAAASAAAATAATTAAVAASAAPASGIGTWLLKALPILSGVGTLLTAIVTPTALGNSERPRPSSQQSLTDQIAFNIRQATRDIFDDRRAARIDFINGRTQAETFVNNRRVDGYANYRRLMEEMTTTLPSGVLLGSLAAQIERIQSVGDESTLLLPSIFKILTGYQPPVPPIPTSGNVASAELMLTAFRQSGIGGGAFAFGTTPPGANDIPGYLGSGEAVRLLSDTFNQSAFELMQVGPTIENAAAQFGPIAGQGMLSSAAQFGAIAGAAAAAAMGGVTITARAPAALEPAVNLGGNGPF